MLTCWVTRDCETGQWVAHARHARGPRAKAVGSSRTQALDLVLGLVADLLRRLDDGKAQSESQ